MYCQNSQLVAALSLQTWCTLFTTMNRRETFDTIDVHVQQAKFPIGKKRKKRNFGYRKNVRIACGCCLFHCCFLKLVYPRSWINSPVVLRGQNFPSSSYPSAVVLWFVYRLVLVQNPFQNIFPVAKLDISAKPWGT